MKNYDIGENSVFFCCCFIFRYHLIMLSIVSDNISTTGTTKRIQVSVYDHCRKDTLLIIIKIYMIHWSFVLVHLGKKWSYVANWLIVTN